MDFHPSRRRHVSWLTWPFASAPSLELSVDGDGGGNPGRRPRPPGAAKASTGGAIRGRGCRRRSARWWRRRRTVSWMGMWSKSVGWMSRPRWMCYGQRAAGDSGKVGHESCAPRQRSAAPAAPRRHPQRPHRQDQIPGRPGQLRPATRTPRTPQQRRAGRATHQAPPATAPRTQEKPAEPRPSTKVRWLKTALQDQPRLADTRTRYSRPGPARTRPHNKIVQTSAVDQPTCRDHDDRR